MKFVKKESYWEAKNGKDLIYIHEDNKQFHFILNLLSKTFETYNSKTYDKIYFTLEECKSNAIDKYKWFMHNK